MICSGLIRRLYELIFIKYGEKCLAYSRPHSNDFYYSISFNCKTDTSLICYNKSSCSICDLYCIIDNGISNLHYILAVGFTHGSGSRKREWNIRELIKKALITCYSGRIMKQAEESLDLEKLVR